MEQMRKWIACLLALAMAVGFASCGSGNVQDSGSDRASAQNPSPEQGKTQVITDILGREVEIPLQVESIVGLSSAPRFITYAGAADKLVGVSQLEQQGDPGMPHAYVNKERFASCTAVSSGGSGDTIYTEELIQLNPDVIIMKTSVAEKADELQAQLDIPVVTVDAVSFMDPAFSQSLTLIGQIAGTEEHANQVAAAVQGWAADLDARTRDIPDEDKPAVYTGALGFSGAHGFEGTSANFPPFVAIHAKNVADETGEKGTFLVDLEKVAVWDPEYIFLNPGSMNLVNEDYAVNPDFYHNLTAVQEGKLYTMVSFNYFSTNMELAIVDAYFAGSVLYPEQFADIRFEEKAEEIFNTMLGCDYLDVLNQNGQGFGTITIGE